MEKKKASSTNGAGITGCHENRSISIAMHKTQVQWIKDLNINPTMLNLIEKKVESSLPMHGHWRPTYISKYNPSSTDTKSNNK